MLKRLLVGLMIGIVAGAALGFGLLQLLANPMQGALGYAFAAVTGVLVGLVAGKPIWAKGALVEAGLKAFIGALLACGLLFGLRFVPFSLPGFAGAATAPIGQHAFGALAAVATLLAVFYEIDNTGGDEEAVDKNAPTRKRVPGPTSKRPGAEAELDGLDEEESAGKAKRGR
jgi:hypothetical protein